MVLQGDDTLHVGKLTPDVGFTLTATVEADATQVQASKTEHKSSPGADISGGERGNEKDGIQFG